MAKTKPVVDPADAPVVEPRDAPMPEATPAISKEAFLEQAKKTAAVNHWHKMVNAEAGVRTLRANGQVGVETPQGAAIVVEDRPQVLADMVERQETEAARLRRVTTSMVKTYELDELELLAQRIGWLRQYAQQNQADLWLHELYVEHPDQVGFVMIDGVQAIDVEASKRAISLLTVALADAQAELDYYESQPIK